MHTDNASERANELIRRFVLDRFRGEPQRNEHLRNCPDATVSDLDGGDGGYVCDTGCEYVRLEAVVSCPHGEREEYEWGEFGEMADIIDGLTELEGRA